MVERGSKHHPFLTHALSAPCHPRPACKCGVKQHVVGMQNAMHAIHNDIHGIHNHIHDMQNGMRDIHRTRNCGSIRGRARTRTRTRHHVYVQFLRMDTAKLHARASHCRPRLCACLRPCPRNTHRCHAYGIGHPWARANVIQGFFFPPLPDPPQDPPSLHDTSANMILRLICPQP